MDDPNCVICGGRKSEAMSWQTYCELCATTTWGPAVLASFIRDLIDCKERLKEAEAKLRMLDQRG